MVDFRCLDGPGVSIVVNKVDRHGRIVQFAQKGADVQTQDVLDQREELSMFLRA